MTTEEEENMKITGFKTVEEFVAYEKGYNDHKKLTEEFIKNWKGSTNSFLGKLLMSKINQFKE